MYVAVFCKTMYVILFVKQSLCRLVEVLSEGCVASEELVCEVVITLGSFAHGMLPPPPCGLWIVCSCWCVVIGTADDVCAVVRSRALPVLVRGEEGEGLPVLVGRGRGCLCWLEEGEGLPVLVRGGEGLPVLVRGGGGAACAG